MTAPPAPPRRPVGVSVLFLYLVLSFILLVFSILVLYQGVTLYSNGQVDIAVVWISMGALGMATSFFITWRLRRGAMKPQLSPLNVVTVAECSKCDFKSLRKFERGDYIFKQVEKCSKCSNSMTITSIYFEEAAKKGGLFTGL